MTPLESELGWAAGIVDGDGSIQILRIRQRRYVGFSVLLSVSNTSVRLLERWADIVGTGTIYEAKKRNPKWKRAWVCYVKTSKITTTLELLGPYLYLKKPQCDLALEAAKIITGRLGPKTASYRTRAERFYEEMAKLNRRGSVVDLGPDRVDPQLAMRL